MSNPHVTIRNGQVVAGASYLFRSGLAAFAASGRVTTNPGILSFSGPAFDDRVFYAARGDEWIGPDGSRGQYAYGRRGLLLDIEGD